MHHAWQTTNFFSAFIRILALVGLRVNSVLTYRFIIFYDNSRFYIYMDQRVDRPRGSCKHQIRKRATRNCCRCESNTTRYLFGVDLSPSSCRHNGHKLASRQIHVVLNDSQSVENRHPAEENGPHTSPYLSFYGRLYGGNMCNVKT